jgi:hypothetical protein
VTGRPKGRGTEERRDRREEQKDRLTEVQKSRCTEGQRNRWVGRGIEGHRGKLK